MGSMRSKLVLFVLAILVIWMVSGIPLDRAAIAGGAFGVYRIALSFVLAGLFG